VDEYATFIKAIGIKRYASLDVIGNPDATWVNLKALESYGLRPLPVYHVTSPLSYLTRVLDNYNDFAIGAMVPFAKNRKMRELVQVLDKVWATILRARGPKNLPRTHAFGMSSERILYRYPFYSADSTGWFQIVKYAKGQNKKVDDRTYKYLRAKNDASMFMYEIEHYKRIEAHATSLWNSRGVTWER
jgi:hypothetical protein